MWPRQLPALSITNIRCFCFLTHSSIGARTGVVTCTAKNSCDHTQCAAAYKILLFTFGKYFPLWDYWAECDLRLFQHSGSELVYTNTLHSVRPFSVIRRKPSLILPLACRIPGLQAKGPQSQITMPSEKETFGELRIWIEIHLPGEGPLAKFTGNPRFHTEDSNRFRRDAESRSETTSTNSTSNSTSGLAVGSRLDQLDLHLMSNCSIERAEMIVSSCIESETEDFAVSRPFLQQGLVTIAWFPVIGWAYDI